MKDQGIMFSAPMVCALVDGRKTQTRRLATSPLAKATPGLRFWVREAFTQPYKATETSNGCIYRADGPEFRSMATMKHQWGAKDGRWTPAIHMPRWASRITLVLEVVRIEHLHAIDDADARAEGIVHDEAKGFWAPGVEHPNKDFPYLSRPTAREMYAALWDVLHGSGQWLENPRVVVFEFRVELCNIDRLAR